MNDIFFYWIIIPVVSFLSISLLTNHPFLVSAPFLAYAIIGFILLLDKTNIKFNLILLLFWGFVVCFGHIFMIRVSGGTHYNMFNEMSIITRGPAWGLVADKASADRYNDSFDAIINTIPAGSKVLNMGVNSDVY